MKLPLSLLLVIWTLLVSCVGGTFVSFHDRSPDSLSCDVRTQIVKEFVLLIGTDLPYESVDDFCTAKGVPKERVLEWHDELRGDLQADDFFVQLQTQVCHLCMPLLPLSLNQCNACRKRMLWLLLQN